MRNYGACATDMVVLVVALDDGVRPQTKEALKMALAANCTVIVALNKVDKVPYGAERVAARQRVLGQIMAEGLATEDFGGMYIYVYVYIYMCICIIMRI
jgi:translation initiation factor IF-2